MEKFSSIIRAEDEQNNTIVFKYEPKNFPVEFTKSSSDFMRSQEGESSDFKISDLVAEQTGIAEKQRKKVEEQVEEETLHKLKSIQESAYKEAFDLGLIEGTEKAFKENQERFRQKLEEIDSIIEKMQEMTVEVFAEKEAEILKLIHNIASKIALFEIKTNPEELIDIIEQLFLELKSDQRVIIKVSEDDALFISTLRERNDQSVDFMKNAKVEVDESIQPGGCILESNYGAIDATIDQRVERVWKAIEERLPRISEQRVEMAAEVVPFVESDDVVESVEDVEKELNSEDNKKAENE